MFVFLSLLLILIINKHHFSAYYLLLLLLLSSLLFITIIFLLCCCCCSSSSSSSFFFFQRSGQTRFLLPAVTHSRQARWTHDILLQPPRSSHFKVFSKMALRVLKKFDELDVKEVMLTGRRRPFASGAKRRERPKSASVRGRRNDPSSAFPNRERRHRGQRSKSSSRRPQSAGPSRKHRELGAFRKAHVSPSGRPEAPEVDNIFGGREVGFTPGKNKYRCRQEKLSEEKAAPCVSRGPCALAAISLARLGMRGQAAT